MVDYDKSTGAAGKIRIRDLGYQIQFWLYCSDSATNASALPWNGRVNGQDVGGTINWTAGRGEAMVAAYDVGSNQTVTFGIGSTGTQGFGGPTSLSVDVQRSSAPNAPTNLRVRAGTLNHFAFGVDYDNGGDNGAAIDQYRVHWRRQEDGWLAWEDMNSSGYTNPSGALMLNPGMVFDVAVQAHNSQGWGPWSAVLSVRTLPGAWVPDPDNPALWRVAVPYAWVDNQWRACVPFSWLDGAWRETIH